VEVLSDTQKPEPFFPTGAFGGGVAFLVVFFFGFLWGVFFVCQLKKPPHTFSSSRFPTFPIPFCVLIDRLIRPRLSMVPFQRIIRECPSRFLSLFFRSSKGSPYEVPLKRSRFTGRVLVPSPLRTILPLNFPSYFSYRSAGSFSFFKILSPPISQKAFPPPPFPPFALSPLNPFFSGW